MLSGGIDSVSALYRLLKDTTDDIWAHHVLLEHQPNRNKEEELATQEVTRWLSTNVRRFTFTQNTFTYPVELRIRPSDMFIVGFVAASIAVSFSLKYGVKFSHITTGHTASDFVKKASNIRVDGMRATIEQQFFYQEKNLTSIELPKDYEKNLDIIKDIPDTSWYPNRERFKKEVIEYIPAELLGLCWSCHTPTEFLQPCGVCDTCVEVDEIGITGVSEGLIQKYGTNQSP